MSQGYQLSRYGHYNRNRVVDTLSLGQLRTKQFRPKDRRRIVRLSTQPLRPTQRNRVQTNNLGRAYILRSKLRRHTRTQVINTQIRVTRGSSSVTVTSKFYANRFSRARGTNQPVHTTTRQQFQIDQAGHRHTVAKNFRNSNKGINNKSKSRIKRHYTQLMTKVSRIRSTVVNLFNISRLVMKRGFISINFNGAYSRIINSFLRNRCTSVTFTGVTGSFDNINTSMSAVRHRGQRLKQRYFAHYFAISVKSNFKPFLQDI